MKSPASRHFPPVVFRNGEKCLWNRVKRSAHADRPEERVRLRYLDYLTLEADWPRGRIAAETSLAAPGNSRSLRADLICYSEEMTPDILVECKAESVALDESAAIQIARYNRSVNAPRLCITNGILDYWFQIEKGKPVELESAPLQIVTGPELLKRDPGYWQERGFVGAGSPEPLMTGVSRILPGVFGGQSRLRYLAFQKRAAEVSLDHYYRLIRMGDSDRLAVTFSGSAAGATFLIAVLNRNGKNHALLIVNLDRLYGSDPVNGRLITAEEEVDLDARKQLPFDTDNLSPDFIENLPGYVYDIFNKLDG